MDRKHPILRSMKAAFLLLVALGATAQQSVLGSGSAVGNGAAVDLFFLCGQSNMSGRVDEGFVARPEDTKVLYSYLSDGPFAVVSDSGDAFVRLTLLPTGYYGPELTFARTLVHHGMRPVIVKVSVGATSLAGGWNSRGAGEWFGYWKARARLVMELLQAQDVTIHCRAFCWMQGETDALDGGSADSYEDHFGDFVADVNAHLRELAGDSDPILFVTALIRNVSEGSETVRAAQRAVMERQSMGCWFDTDDLAVRDGVHFTVDSVNELGRRFAETYAERAGIPLALELRREEDELVATWSGRSGARYVQVLDETGHAVGADVSVSRPPCRGAVVEGEPEAGTRPRDGGMHFATASTPTMKPSPANDPPTNAVGRRSSMPGSGGRRSRVRPALPEFGPRGGPRPAGSDEPRLRRTGVEGSDFSWSTSGPWLRWFDRDERFRKKAKLLLPNLGIWEQPPQFPGRKKAHLLHFRLGFQGIPLSFHPPPPTLLEKAAAEGDGQILPPGEDEMRLDREVPIRGLDEITLPHSSNLGGHVYLILEGSDVFDHGIGVNEVKGAVRELGHVARVSLKPDEAVVYAPGHREEVQQGHFAVRGERDPQPLPGAGHAPDIEDEKRLWRRRDECQKPPSPERPHSARKRTHQPIDDSLEHETVILAENRLFFSVHYRSPGRTTSPIATPFRG